MSTALPKPPSSNPFIKQLAANGPSIPSAPPSTPRKTIPTDARTRHTDRPTRDRAVSSLRTYLRRSGAFAPLELLKLWKGLFYCMWMSDRPRTQQRLAVDLAELVDVLARENFVGFLRAFWETMGRELAGIEALRMDKFLFLIRRYLFASFRYLARRKWADTDLVDEYLDVLASIPLNPRDMKIPNGLRYHVIDIYIDELDKAISETDAQAPLKELLWPLQALREHTVTKNVRERVKDVLEDERIEGWKGSEEVVSPNKGRIEKQEAGKIETIDAVGANSPDDSDGEDDEWGGIDE
ncbi:hypothetical protein LTR66_012390 [Elasticomyces elasticus]|nr:hypothetical protein LTR66_012390 [Elasticomyces elasticus]KAK4987155.1 hypothetical protein LTR50_004852 [Elasticomyces elasticus]